MKLWGIKLKNPSGKQADFFSSNAMVDVVK
jgi:hypothetical protein